MKGIESRRLDNPSSVDAETLGRLVHHAEPGRGVMAKRRGECPVCFGCGQFRHFACKFCKNGVALVPLLREVGK